MRHFMLVFILFSPLIALAQSTESEIDALFIKDIHNHTLAKGACYEWLDHLSSQIGGRLSGSEESFEAVYWTAEKLKSLADTVYLQPCKVPHWERGALEQVKITNLSKSSDILLNALALGNSVASPPNGIEAEVIELNKLDDLAALGRKNIEGKIVFFNRPMDPKELNTFYAYGGAVDQRGNGPSKASEYGAIGAIVRSMTTSQDDIPHTGTTRYAEGVTPIPAVAISTNDANMLSQLLKQQKIKVFIKTNCRMVEMEKESYNVVAEIKGSTYPDEIILVGGHLDSWDVGGGAHDDGAGCVHSMQVFETIRTLGYVPQRTLRCVLFMNEENGLGGGRAYAEASNQAGEFHLAAIESDAGGFSPRGFTFDATEDVFASYFRQISAWSFLLEPYQLFLIKGGSGADINPLKIQKGLLSGLRPDSQRYFDYHHTAADVIDAVNERELKLGAAAMTSLVFLIDKYGLSANE